MTLLWQAPIPAGTVRDSVLAMPDGSSYFLDRESGTINRVSKDNGVEVRGKLSLTQAALFESRILAVGPR